MIATGKRRRHPALVPALVVAFGAILALILSYGTARYLEGEARAEFDDNVKSAREFIDARIARSQELLRGVRGLFDASQDVTREEFRQFAEAFDLRARFPGVRAVEFLRHVPHSARAGYEQSRRSDFLLKSPAFRIQPAGDRRDYLVVDFVEPTADNAASLGQDVSYDPAVRTMLEKARDTGRTGAASSMLALVEPGGRHGIRLLEPVYRGGAPIATSEQRRLAFQGYAGVDLDMNSFMSAMRHSPGMRHLDLVIHDLGAAAGARAPAILLYDGRQSGRDMGVEPRFVATTELDVGGRRWQIELASRIHGARWATSALPAAVLVIGLLITLLIAWLLHTMATARSRSVALAQEMTADLQRSRERLEIALGGSNLVLWDIDIGADLIYLSEQWRDIVGDIDGDSTWTMQQFMAKVHPDDTDGLRDAYVDAVKGVRPALYCEYRIQARDGEWRWLLSRGKVAERNSAGRALRIAGTLADITARKRNQQALEQSEQRLELVLEGADLGLWDWDLVTGHMVRNARWATMLGYTSDQITPNTGGWEKLVHPEDHPGARRALQDHLEGKSRAIRIEYRMRARSGDWIWVLDCGKVVERDAEGRALRVTGTVMDVTDRKRAEERIQHMAYHDALTGLPNRALFEDHVRQAIAMARRSGTLMAVLFLDLDHFKNVNDTLGHEAGDRLLRIVAKRLRDSLREGDTVARLGGDEFVVSLPSLEQGADAVHVADKALQSLARVVELSGQQLHVSASIGISLYPGDGEDAAALMRHADTAMYHAKAAGRGQFQFFHEEMNEKVRRRLFLERGLRQALDRKELHLHYQPLIDLSTGETVGAEALLRWRFGEEGNIDPSEFVPLAEETGLILTIGAWVLREACLQAQIWSRDGFPHFKIAVNLSARQFRDPGLVNAVKRILAETGLRPGQLELEITEGLLLQHDEQTVGMLEELGIIEGARIAVDDFGTGYSSLTYLKRLPIHKLKIDQSFVRDLDTNAEDAAIVEGVIAIAKGLKLAVTAEGVENREQAAKLRSMGCRYAQGFHFSRPLDVPGFTAFLQKDNPQVRRGAG